MRFGGIPIFLLLALVFVGMAGAHGSPPPQTYDPKIEVDDSNHDKVSYNGVEYFFPEKSIEYPSGFRQLRVHCRPIGNSAGAECGNRDKMPFGDIGVPNPDVRVEICGYPVRVEKKRRILRSPDYAYYDILPPAIPSDLPCSLGEHEIEFRFVSGNHQGEPADSLMMEGGEIDVNADPKVGDPNRGRYVVLRLRGNNDKLEDFFLTNEPWYDDDGGGILGFNEFPDLDSGRALPKGALFLGSEADRNLGDKSDEGVWVADFGVVEEFDKSLWDHMALPYDTGDGSAGWFAGDNNGKEHVKNTLKTDFSSLTEGPKFDQKCSVASNNYKWNGNCAPLHSNGEYTPQGEIIVATKPSENSFYLNQNPHPSTYFFVCRGDYTGPTPEDSKVVKVQEKSAGFFKNEWKYYHCNTLNDWELVECDPGQKVSRESGKLQCVEKDPVTVEVEFFNMSSVPRPSGAAGDELIAGFKVDSSEIQKYEDLMGEGLKRIDAECWMGDDDQRPSSESDSGTFRLNYDEIGFGDAWVLGKIPYRNGVNNQTYSCIWGFSEDADYGAGMIDPPVTNEGIYESTRNRPLRSVEGSRINVNYTETIQPNYTDLAKPSELDETVDRLDIWTPYSAGDTRSYIDNTDEDMFDFPNAFPYCTTPTSPSSVLANIICS